MRLKGILESAVVLCGLNGPPVAKKQTLSGVLSERLTLYGVPVIANASEEQLKSLTAMTCLEVLISLRLEYNRLSSDKAPLFGSRDHKIVNTLASIVARWGLAPALDPSVLPDIFRETGKGKITELQSADLADITTSLTLCFNTPTDNRPIVPDELLNLILPQILPVYLPALLQLQHEEPNERIAEVLSKMLDFLSPYVAMSMLLLLTKPEMAPWIIQEASQLLSAQLIRHEGVYCLLKLLVPDPDDQLNMAQMDLISKLLTTPPRSLSSKEQYQIILPPLYTLIKWAAIRRYDKREWAVPPSLVRCSAYILTKLLDKGLHEAAPHILRLFREPYSQANSTPNADDDDENSLDDTLLPSVQLREGSETLLTYFQNMPPSSHLVDEILSPCLPLLLSLYCFAFPSQASLQNPLFKIDERIRENTKTILAIWLRTTPVDKLALSFESAIERIVKGNFQSLPQEAYWSHAEDGGICLRQPRSSAESAFTLSNIDQLALINLLKEEGTDATRAALMVRWIGELETKSVQTPESITFKTRLLMQALESWGSEALKDPKDALAFVAFTLQSTDEEAPAQKLHELQLVQEQPDVDEESGLLLADSLKSIGLGLLLAVLEGHAALNAQSHPVLKLIQDRVALLASQPALDENILLLAREADSVLHLRQTVSDLPSTPTLNPSAKSQDTYREALKLLQDPILPVRAQGLAQLRSLIGKEDTDKALLPGILDTLLRFIDDDDSFLYLSAVQGLTDICAFQPQQQGRHAAQKIMLVYAGREAVFSERRLDRKLRVGEALAHLIHGAASALAVYVDLIVPGLLELLGDSDRETVLRASALTILATCVEASPFAMIPYLERILDATLTLLTLESQPFRNQIQVEAQQAVHEEQEPDQDSDSTNRPIREEETPAALTTDSKHPALRRGALLLITLTARSQNNLRNASADLTTTFFPKMLIDRAQTTLNYVSKTDCDELVRHQAGEALQEVNELSA